MNLGGRDLLQCVNGRGKQIRKAKNRWSSIIKGKYPASERKIKDGEEKMRISKLGKRAKKLSGEIGSMSRKESKHDKCPPRIRSLAKRDKWVKISQSMHGREEFFGSINSNFPPLCIFPNQTLSNILVECKTNKPCQPQPP